MPTSGWPQITGCPAVSAHLLEMAGDRPAAREAYLTAARRASNLPQQRYLNAQAARLAGA